MGNSPAQLRAPYSGGSFALAGLARHGCEWRAMSALQTTPCVPDAAASSAATRIELACTAGHHGRTPSATISSTVSPDSVEAKLLFACSRVHIDARSSASIRELLRHPINWSLVMALAARHRVRPLLYKSLAAIQDNRVPAETLAHFAEFATANARRSLFLSAQLLRVLELFRLHGIAAAAFKGPMLASDAYGNSALREAGDIDLLVRRRDIIAARKLLLDWGFHAAYPTATPSEANYLSQLRGGRENRYLLDHSEHHLISPVEMVNVDLHWAVTLQQFGLALTPRELWSWLKPQFFGGRSILGFGPEELLIVLCINGAKDCWRRLDRICDVAELLRSHPKIDWQRVFQLARQIGGMRMVCVGLKLSADLLGTRIAHAALAQVTADESVPAIVERVGKDLFAELNGEVEKSGADKSLFQLAIRERIRDRIRYALCHLEPTVGDWAALPLPTPLGFLHYVLRPLRLLSRVTFSRNLPVSSHLAR